MEVTDGADERAEWIIFLTVPCRWVELSELARIIGIRISGGQKIEFPFGMSTQQMGGDIRHFAGYVRLQ